VAEIARKLVGDDAPQRELDLATLCVTAATRPRAL
jgi:hypothetical protein